MASKKKSSSAKGAKPINSRNMIIIAVLAAVILVLVTVGLYYNGLKPMAGKGIGTPCIDSDGYNTSKKGSTTDGDIKTDYCSASGYLVEYFCIVPGTPGATPISRNSATVTCTNGCTDGACRKGPGTCSDTDTVSGRSVVLDTKGYVTMTSSAGGWVIGTDYCTSDLMLKEFSCTTGSSWSEWGYRCDLDFNANSKCYNGACCIPKSAASECATQCGSIDNGCGGTIQCAACTQCNDKIDNDKDGMIDTLDYGCIDEYAKSPKTESSKFVCDDGIDNDVDGKIDYKIDGTGDPDCTYADDTNEACVPNCYGKNCGDANSCGSGYCAEGYCSGTLTCAVMPTPHSNIPKCVAKCSNPSTQVRCANEKCCAPNHCPTGTDPTKGCV